MRIMPATPYLIADFVRVALIDRLRGEEKRLKFCSHDVMALRVCKLEEMLCD